MRTTEPDQVYIGKNGDGKVTCMHRCKITKYIIEKGKKKVTDTLLNQCRLLHNQNKRCLHANDNEHTCNIPKFK